MTLKVFAEKARKSDQFVFAYDNGVSRAMTYDGMHQGKVIYINTKGEHVRDDNPDATTVFPVFPVIRDGKELYRL